MSDLDLLGPKYMWVLINDGSLDVSPMEGLLKEGDNVVVVSPQSYSDDEVAKVVNDFHCLGIQNVLLSLWLQNKKKSKNV